MKNTCGNCLYGKLKPDDLNTRICWGGPPSIFMVPTAKGPMLQTFRPPVKASDDACALWKAKILMPEVLSDSVPSA